LSVAPLPRISDGPDRRGATPASATVIGHTPSIQTTAALACIVQ
jgi:hypothetical protein